MHIVHLFRNLIEKRRAAREARDKERGYVEYIAITSITMSYVLSSVIGTFSTGYGL